MTIQMTEYQASGSFTDENMTAPRYMGIPTFMRTPLIEDFADYDIAMIGVPYDGAVTNRPGARHGPREIRNASTMLRAVHQSTRINPYELCMVGDGGDVPFTNVYDIDSAHEDITRFYDSLREAGEGAGEGRVRGNRNEKWVKEKRGVVPLTAGGDHSITLPIFRSLANDGPIGMIQFDAHCDTWDEFFGSKSNHGSPFRRAVEENLLDPTRTVQIGIRGAQNITAGWDFSHDTGMRVIFMEEFAKLGVEKVIQEARKVVGNGPTYISFDIDSLDPAFAPGTGTPEIGGITTLEAQTVLRGFRRLNLIGGDVVEVAPPFDHSGITAFTGATLMYEILCLLAESVALKF